MEIGFYVLLVIVLLLIIFILFEKKNSKSGSPSDYQIETVKLESENKYLQDENKSLTDKLATQNEQLSKLTEENIELSKKLAAETSLKVQLQEQIKLEKDLLEVARKEFSAIAVETLNQGQKNLLEKNQDAVKITIEPLNQKLKDFKDEIVKYQNDHTQNTGKLTQQIEDLKTRSIELSSSAQNLTEVLTKNRNVKGWYGEDLAKTILENSGLVEGVHFLTQNQEKTDTEETDDKKVRPDITLKLPDNRNLVIDSKAILSSLVSVSDDDENSDKKIFSAVKARVDELSKKKYENIKDLNQPDFVIMYIPIEPIVNLLYTTKDGMEIITNSRRNNIVITGSISLITIINLIEKIWKEDSQIKNLDNIISTGAKLYDAVVKHAEEILDIQKTINNAKEKTDETIKRLVDSSRTKISIFKEAEKLKSFGIQSAKQIPENLLSAMENNLIDKINEAD